MLKLLHQFISCHDGKLNRIMHVIGLSFLIYGVFQKNLSLLIIGSIIQELGHFYQFHQTGQLKDSPLACLKSQSLFVYPIFIILIIYTLY